MKKLFTIALFGLVAVAVTMAPDLALAQGPVNTGGDGLKSDVLSIITGSYGTIVGLVIALFGLYMWLVQQASWGIIMIIGGVAITLFPSIFTSVQGGLQTTFAGAGLNSNTTINNLNSGNAGPVQP